MSAATPSGPQTGGPFETGIITREEQDLLNTMYSTSSVSGVQYNNSIVFAGANGASNSWIFQATPTLSGQVSTAPNGNTSPFNLYVSNDTVDTTTIGNGLLSLLSVEDVAQAGHTGARNAIFGYTIVAGSPSAIPAKGYCGIQSRCVTQANLGGAAGSFITYGGNCFGGNSDAQVKAGSTYLVGAVGHEIDCIVTASANVAEKLGLSIVQTSIDVNRGDYDDDAIRIANQNGAATTWKYGLAFGAYGRQWAFGADSTLVYAWQRQVGAASPSIALNGVDFRNVTFQTGGFFLASNGFTVDPNGVIAASNQGTSAHTATLTATAGFAALLAQGAASSGAYAAIIKAGTGSGTSLGLSITAGTTAVDAALLIRDQTNAHTYLTVFGDGHVGLGYNGSGVSLTVASTGQLQLNAPSAGANLLVTGLSAGTASIRINTTATTGAQTATFSATNKPGSGTTSPGTWLPMNLDGTVYYIPCWT